MTLPAVSICSAAATVLHTPLAGTPVWGAGQYACVGGSAVPVLGDEVGGLLLPLGVVVRVG
ncbi:hypothetical protein ACPFP2_11095, partial [Micromonospora citrea]|uniref:hypothetical protein n=1 Tax=Micromonospora citrea TaxID=47855 RepID=UPI003C3BC942